MKEIDNKKMWESLIWKVGEPLRQHIENALSEQGLTVNDNGEIVSIEPATEEEILKAKFDSPELPEIVKERVREITEKPTVSWDSVNGRLSFYNLTKEQGEKLKSVLIGEPKQELTKFDSIQKIIYDLLSSSNGEWLEEDYMTEMSKNISEDIRKQIVQEIDTEKLTEKQTVLLRAANGCYSPIIEFGANCYKRGIKHCLEEIELKGIIEKGG